MSDVARQGIDPANEELGGAFGEWRQHGVPADEVSQLVQAIRRSFAERRLPNVSTDLPHWAAALDVLFLTAQLEPLEFAARILLDRYPSFGFAEQVCTFFDRLPPEDGQLPFTDDTMSAVQIVPRPDAETVLLLFTDRRNCLGVPLNAIHRWLGALPSSLVYLRDFRRRHYMNGIPQLGANYDSTIVALRKLISDLGGKRIAIHSGSNGVYGALSYSVDLDADTVLAFGGASNLTMEFAGPQPRWQRTAEQLASEQPGVDFDLRNRFAGLAHPPQVRLVYAADNEEDRLQAEWLGGYPGVTAEAVPGYAGHNVATEIMRRGAFQAMLDWLVGPGKGRLRSAGAP